MIAVKIVYESHSLAWRGIPGVGGRRSTLDARTHPLTSNGLRVARGEAVWSLAAWGMRRGS
jgi:hypothetical protein